MDLTNFAVSQGGTGKIGCPVLATVSKGAECSPATLYMISLGHKKASAKLAGRIEQATFGKVSRHDLRPDIFGPTPEGDHPPRQGAAGPGATAAADGVPVSEVDDQREAA